MGISCKVGNVKDIENFYTFPKSLFRIGPHVGERVKISNHVRSKNPKQNCILTVSEGKNRASRANESYEATANLKWVYYNVLTYQQMPSNPTHGSWLQISFLSLQIFICFLFKRLPK